MIIDRIVPDDSDDDHDDDGGDAQHAGVIPVNGIPSFPAQHQSGSQSTHNKRMHVMHTNSRTTNAQKQMRSNT